MVILLFAFDYSEINYYVGAQGTCKAGENIEGRYIEVVLN